MEHQRAVTLRFLAEPTDVNFGGKVHGGAAMKWIDQAAYACASGWSKSYCVTVYVGGIRFLAPIKIGDLVEIDAKIIYTGETSMHIAVDVHAQGTRSDESIKTTHCVIVFVALDEDGNTKKVPEWIPQSEEDHQLEAYAKKLMERRKEIDEAMMPYIKR